MINYIGHSMNPTLIDGDRLSIRPYGGQPVRAGDIIVFQHPTDKYLVVHRVFSTKQSIIRTRGDNNYIQDKYALKPEDITGRVVSAHRGKKRIQVTGGMSGRLQAAKCHLIKHLDRKVSRLLHPAYELLAKTGSFRKIFGPWIKTRTVCFQRKNGTELQVLMGRKIIARLPPGSDSWQIKRPFRIFIDETSLPVSKSIQNNPIPAKSPLT